MAESGRRNTVSENSVGSNSIWAAVDLTSPVPSPWQLVVTTQVKEQTLEKLAEILVSEHERLILLKVWTYTWWLCHKTGVPTGLLVILEKTDPKPPLSVPKFYARSDYISNSIQSVLHFSVLMHLGSKKEAWWWLVNVLWDKIPFQTSLHSCLWAVNSSCRYTSSINHQSAKPTVP